MVDKGPFLSLGIWEFGEHPVYPLSSRLAVADIADKTGICRSGRVKWNTKGSLRNDFAQFLA